MFVFIVDQRLLLNGLLCRREIIEDGAVRTGGCRENAEFKGIQRTPRIAVGFRNNEAESIRRQGHGQITESPVFVGKRVKDERLEVFMVERFELKDLRT